MQFFAFPRRLAYLVLLLLSLTPTSWSASFDCDQAATDIERRICASESLSRLDAQLGEKYQSLRSLLEEADRSRLLGSQRQWISQRNQCRDNNCLERLYRTRLDALSDRLLRQHYQGQPLKVSSVQEESWENGAALVARLTVPVDVNTDWRRYLKVSRGSLVQPEDAWVLSDDRKALIYPFLEPSSTYTLDIDPGMTGINGQTLVEASTRSIETRRTQPSASFADNGQVLAMALKRALPVTTLNIDEVNLDLYRIAPERIGRWSRYTEAERRHYNQLNDFAKHNPLVHSARFPIEHQANQRTTTNLDLSDIAALDEPGAYLAVLGVPGHYDYRFETNLFTVSDIGLQVRRNDQQLRVYTHSISSGLSRDDVTLELYDDNNLIGRQPVDADGVAVFDAFFKKGHTLLARHEQELTILRYDRSPLDLSAYQNAVTRHAPHQVFAWGPRDLYRPGETFDVYALLKDYDGRGVDSLPLNLMLFDATGSRITTRTVNVGAHGRYEFQYRLEDSAKTGRWRVSFALPGQNNVLTEYEFSVEDFQPERLDLRLFDGDPSKRRRVSSYDQVTIPVQGDYLYGAPASGNKLDGYVVAEVDRHPFDRWKSYFFGLDQERIPNPRHDLAPTELDAGGAARLAIGLDNWRSVTSPLALTATVSLYESGGRPVTRSTTVTNILSQSLVGVEPQFGPRPEYNSRLAFKTILTDAEGGVLAGEGYRARLMREDRNYYWTYSDAEGWRWHYDPLDYEVFSTDLTYDGQSATEFVMPVTWGQYRLEIRDADNNLVNRFRFRTGWSGWQDTGSDALRPDQVRLSFQRDRYAPGETAAARLVPPVDGHATVTVETNDGVLWQDRIEVSADGTDLKIPIGEGWDRHDIYLTATVLTPGDMVHSVAPKRAFGFIHLPVERPDARLDIELDLPDKLQPRHTAEAILRLNGDSLPSAPVWVSVAAVDVGVLNITRYQTPDPAGYLFGARRYDYHLYDVYGRIIENAGFDYSRQRFGGGFAESAAELARGGEKPSNNVQIVSLQSTAVAFDANGEARVSLDIPEFNGRLRWMAVAWSDRQFGSTEADTQVADPLVTQLSRPRFLAVGDESRLTLDVSNQSGAEQQLTVEFEVTGALATESWSRRLTLAEGEKHTLTFPVAAVGLGEAPIRASISNADQEAPLTVSREWQLSTRSAYPGVTRKDQAVIDPGSDWTPALAFDDLIAGSVQAQLIVSNRPPIDVGSHFDALLRYPYGCTEQTTSSGYPWVLVSPEAADRLGLRKMIESRFSRRYTEIFRREQIEVAVDRVMTRQASTGGFGLWRSGGEERFWLTVYVADFLTAARDAGASVPNDALNLTLDRLDAYLRDSVSINQRWSANNDYYRFATQAYAAYVLARSNRVPLSHLRRLMQRSEGHFEESALPWAHLGYALQRMGDQQQADRAFDRARNITYRQGYYGDYGSELRDTALTYAVLANAGQADAVLLLRVFEQVRERRWLSTQERNALFQAATAGAIGEDDRVRATLVTEAFKQQLDQDDAFRTIIGAADLDSLKAISNTGETLYASLELVGVPASPPSPVNNEMRVQRNYFDLDGKSVTLGELNSGDLVMVRLRAGASRSIPDGLVVDLLPAGLELENQNLANASADLSKLSIEGQNVTDWQQQGDIQHVEYRDDRFVAALAINEYRDTDLFYLARAVTPGVYRVPPPYIEDMYRPYYHAIGITPADLTVLP